jgi:hypothetical protein
MTALALEPPTSRSAPRCRYQAQDSTQTLAEGLAEYYALNEGRLALPQDLPAGSAALFRCHDICHVIFGLDTTLADEAMADTRTLLSCDVGWARYADYLGSDPQAQAIFRQVGYLTAIVATIRTSPRIGRAVWEAWRMPKRWPWDPPALFMGRRLADLRAEFGIRLI